MLRPLCVSSLLAAPLLCGGLGGGCSLEVSPRAEALHPEVDLPPLLEFETPYEGLVYSTAYDERPHAPGVELSVRVRVDTSIRAALTGPSPR
jgi:hypothetical protein